MAEHNYITVGGRRWCRGCNTYQVHRGGRWRDGYPPSPWPGYEATQAKCELVPAAGIEPTSFPVHSRALIPDQPSRKGSPSNDLAR